MINNCKNCGLPIFHGASGYVGAQCKCGLSAKPNYNNNALADLLKERDKLRAENERLSKENTDTRSRWSEYGREIEAERDTLRKQLDEARRLLREMNASGYDWHIQINAWLED